jgi:hypothetical protein
MTMTFVQQTGARVFLPNHPAGVETGRRRGTFVAVAGDGLPPDIHSLGFPFTLYAERSL